VGDCVRQGCASRVACGAATQAAGAGPPSVSAPALPYPWRERGRARRPRAAIPRPQRAPPPSSPPRPRRRPRAARCDELSYRFASLPNGLRAVLVSDPETDKAAASLDVRVGSLLDPPELQGLAHFLEHMLFYASEK
jgi:hypothetical protein